MNTKASRAIATVALTFALAAGAQAQDPAEGKDIGAIIAGGEAGVFLRYRYEFVDQASFSENANASTLLLRLNYETDEWRNWSGFVEFDHVMEVLVNDFNSDAGTSSPNRDQYPVVADPKGPDLNQLYFQWIPNDDWKNRIGRQRIDLDDQRFVGGVFWRQNEQTYDSVSFNYTGFAKTNVFYSYVNNVNRIFGTTVPAGDHRQNTHLLNASFSQVENWKFVGYAYVIDNDDMAAFSTSTFGARATGSLTSGQSKFDLLGELATQSDNANNPASFDAGYYRLQGIWSMNAFSAGVGIESLGSDNGQGFRTPLATLHAFNGWADQFLATPAAGLEDFYIRGGYKPGKWNLQIIYHDFSAESGGADYGSEIDFSASRGLGDGYSLLLKFADFRSDNVAFQDTTKFWVMLTADFG
jgi:hypothetical protein